MQYLGRLQPMTVNWTRRAWNGGVLFARVINHPRMDFILMLRHSSLVWTHRHRTPIVSVTTRKARLNFIRFDD